MWRGTGPGGMEKEAEEEPAAPQRRRQSADGRRSLYCLVSGWGPAGVGRGRHTVHISWSLWRLQDCDAAGRRTAVPPSPQLVF